MQTDSVLPSGAHTLTQWAVGPAKSYLCLVGLYACLLRKGLKLLTALYASLGYTLHYCASTWKQNSSRGALTLHFPLENTASLVFWATAEELKRISRKCKSARLAYESCWKANVGSPEACKALETRLTECMAEHVCPQEAEAFKSCVSKAYAVDADEWSPTACEEQVEAMQKCLRTRGLYPFVMPN